MVIAFHLSVVFAKACRQPIMDCKGYADRSHDQKARIAQKIAMY